MAKELKIGVHKGDGDPEYLWNVVLLSLAIDEGKRTLDDDEYYHEAEQVQVLATEPDPSHPLTQDVRRVDELLELRDKGGPLQGHNVRTFFAIDKPRRAIVVLGVILKQNNGPTPIGDKRRMERRRRKYFAGDYGVPEVRSSADGDESDEKGDARG